MLLFSGAEKVLALKACALLAKQWHENCPEGVRLYYTYIIASSTRRGKATWAEQTLQ